MLIKVLSVIEAAAIWGSVVSASAFAPFAPPTALPSGVAHLDTTVPLPISGLHDALASGELTRQYLAGRNAAIKSMEREQAGKMRYAFTMPLKTFIGPVTITTLKTQELSMGTDGSIVYFKELDNVDGFPHIGKMVLATTWRLEPAKDPTRAPHTRVQVWAEVTLDKRPRMVSARIEKAIRDGAVQTARDLLAHATTATAAATAAAAAAAAAAEQQKDLNNARKGRKWRNLALWKRNGQVVEGAYTWDEAVGSIDEE